MMFSQARSGSLSGLMAAPCTPPNTEHWFVGVGASADYRTELVLTNPDDGQAEVDLRFYGRNGIVVVPGSPGLIIDGRTSRTVSLQSLVNVEGPLDRLGAGQRGPGVGHGPGPPQRRHPAAGRRLAVRARCPRRRP